MVRDLKLARLVPASAFGSWLVASRSLRVVNGPLSRDPDWRQKKDANHWRDLRSYMRLLFSKGDYHQGHEGSQRSHDWLFERFRGRWVIRMRELSMRENSRVSRVVMLLIGVCAGLSSIAVGQTSGNVVKYSASLKNVKYLFATAEPVANLKPGDVLDTNTLDCFGDAIKKPGDTLSMAPGDNPLTGPFFIDGAEPGDTLTVKILDLEVNGDQGVGALDPEFGALNRTAYTPMLNPPLPERIWFYPIDHASNTATFSGARFEVHSEDPGASVFW